MSFIVTLYEHHSFNQGPPPWDQAGMIVGLNTSWRSLSSAPSIQGPLVNFNDKLTSYHVQAGYTVVFYKDDHFQNEMFRVPPKPLDEAHMENWGNVPGWSDGPNDIPYNDNVSSIRIIDHHGNEIPQP